MQEVGGSIPPGSTNHPLAGTSPPSRGRSYMLSLMRFLSSHQLTG